MKSMKNAYPVVAWLVCLTVIVPAAPPAATGRRQADTTVPKKVAAQLKPIASKIVNTPAGVQQLAADEFVNTRSIASDVRVFPSISDYADKPYMAKIRWVSSRQVTKIYPDADRAAKSTDWLPEGKTAGASGRRVPDQYTATLFYEDGKWVLHEIEWIPDLGNARLPPGFERPGASSTKRGDQTDWQSVFQPGDEPE
jgi:hypothetical protein